MRNKLWLFLVVCLVQGLNAQTLQLTNLSQDVFCSTGKDTLRFSLDYSSIPPNSNIVLYQSTNPSFNPYLGQGDSIGFINIGGNTSSTGQIKTTCPEIVGIFIDACDQGGVLREVDNEYVIMTSGNSGFNVSDLRLKLPNNSINISSSNSCTFSTPSAATMTTLRNGTCDATTLIAASQSDFIPANAIVIVFTGRGTVFNYNFSSYCSSGQPIYILQNSCSPNTANFANNAPNSCPGQYRTTTITVGACADELTYYPCSLPPFDAANPNANDGNYVIHLSTTDTSSTTNGGIRNNTLDKCNGLNFDSIAGVKTFKYPIPNDGTNNGGTATNFCNDGYHYIKAITNPAGSQPVSNSIRYKLVCLDIATDVNNISICSGANAIINTSSSDPNATFSWTVSGGTNITGASAGSGNSINQVLTYSGTTKDSLIYTITATDAGCTKTKSVKVVVNACTTCIAFNLGADTAYCGTFTRTLNANNANAVWNTGVTAATITVNSPGKYYATCGAFTDTINITQSTGINFSFGTSNTTVCTGGNITLDASNAYDTYVWSTGAASQSISVTSPGKYWVDVFKNGCKGTDTISVTQIVTPTKPVLGKDTAFCGSFSMQLSNGSTQTQWTRNNVFVANASSITVTQDGMYIATVTNSCGSFSDTIIITQSSGINFSFGTSITTVCAGGSITLDASNAYDTYIWSTGAVTQSISISTPGKYWVDVYKAGCKGTDTITVSQINKPIKPLLGRDTTFCGSFSMQLSNGSTQTQWTRNNVFVANATSITATQTGMYIATVTNSCGSASDTILISNSSSLSVNLGRDTSLCTGNSIVLNAFNAGANITYLWSNGLQTPTIQVTTGGTYTVTVSDNSCSVTDNIKIDFIDKPTSFSLGNDTAFCGAFSKQLITNDATTTWSTNETGALITISSAGTFTAKISNQCGSKSDTIVITQHALPLVNIGNDTTLNCDSLNLNIGNSYQSIVWNTGDTLPTIMVNTSGVFSVRVTNAFCENSDSIRITIDCVYDVYMPTAFSPNGDGVNDFLAPLSYDLGTVVLSYTIFNRWGEKVFEMNNFTPDRLDIGWNGIFKGQPAQVDNYVYVYTAKMPDSTTKTYKGTFILLR